MSIANLRIKILAQGKDVVQYLVDTDSEGNENEEGGSYIVKLRSKERRPIEIKDYEITGRVVICLNCEEHFNVTDNWKGDCLWHIGMFTNLNCIN